MFHLVMQLACSRDAIFFSSKRFHVFHVGLVLCIFIFQKLDIFMIFNFCSFQFFHEFWIFMNFHEKLFSCFFSFLHSIAQPPQNCHFESKAKNEIWTKNDVRLFKMRWFCGEHISVILPHFQIEYLVIWMLWSLNIQNQSRPFFLKQHGIKYFFSV